MSVPVAAVMAGCDGASGTQEDQAATAGESIPRSGSINVKDPAYGAVGDEVADDTAAVLAAIAAATEENDNATGGTVYLPPGNVFRVTEQIAIPYNVRLMGGGMGEFLGAYGATTIRSEYDGPAILVDEGRYGWGIRDLAITGDSSLGSQDLVVVGTGNNTSPTVYGEIQNVSISNSGRDCLVLDDALHVNCIGVYCRLAARYGLRVEGQSNSNKFSKCQFRECGQFGVYWKGGYGGAFDACTIEANSTHPTDPYGGMWVDPSDSDPAASIGLTLIETHFEENGGVGGDEGAATPLLVSAGDRGCSINEIGSLYIETYKRSNTLAGGEFTSVGVRSNLAVHAELSGTSPVIFINPRNVGAGSFSFTDSNGIATVLDGNGITWGAGDTGLDRSQPGIVKVNSAIQVAPLDADLVPSETIFLDPRDDMLKYKDGSGGVHPLY